MSDLLITTPAFGMPGYFEMILIAAVILLIFGKKIPNIARDLGETLTEFKKGADEARDLKDELINEVKGVKNNLVDEVKEASGLDFMPPKKKKNNS